MGSKCHTDKYRRRRAKEIQNKGQRERREREREQMWARKAAENRKLSEWQAEQVKLDRWEFWRQDPERYALLQRLVNILNAKVQNNPLYRLQCYAQVFRSIWGGLRC